MPSLKRLLPRRILAPLRTAKDLVVLAEREVRREIIAPVWPAKPVSISLMANDVCNSRCEMCAIWKDKTEKGPTLDELRRMLSDPLFSNVRDIGITGGEPTLRPDLADIYQVAIDCLPRLTRASIITNAIQPVRVTERILASSDVCGATGVDFSAMISLDGLGDVHDAVRGWKGNFERALNCIGVLKSKGIALSIGCTVTRTNAQHVDALLDWAIDEKIPARFRVAEFIDRLYNGEQGDVIRSFDAQTRYHLGLFFTRLATQYEPNHAVRRTYLSIRGMLAEGKPRATGCPYHHEAVIVSAQRELLYCSPKSPVIGNIAAIPASRIFFENLQKRAQIKKNSCKDCIHDYHVPPSFTDKLFFWAKCRRQRKIYNLNRLIASASALTPCPASSDPTALRSRIVLIVGWYGTETVGDKAILWAVIDGLRKRRHPPTRILLASFHPFVSQWTRQEMDLGDIEIVETYGRDFEESCRSADEVVIGGGPLMDLQSLDHMLFAFIAAARNGAIARIEGCGIGPLRVPLYVNTVGVMMRLASHVSLRDAASVRRVRSEFGREASQTLDPAILYVRDRMSRANRHLPSATGNDGPTAVFFLRDLPEEYVAESGGNLVARMRSRFETEVLKLMVRLNREKRMRLRLLPMCHVWEGGDDRILNRRLARRAVAEHGIPSADIDVEQMPISPGSVLSVMQAADLNICMRYHSIVLAEELGAPYIAIDYTSGGKIASFLKDIGKESLAISIADISEERLLATARRAMAQTDLQLS